ncbi:MAG: hypothetical protein M1835_000411 [Candelina submexicana]|nr:MAG: hypothetical protein M1835_000411 [Candelina submexicana]
MITSGSHANLVTNILSLNSQTPNGPISTSISHTGTNQMVDFIQIPPASFIFYRQRYRPKSRKSSEGSSDDYTITCDDAECWGSNRLYRQLDLRVWDIIEKEVMDWYRPFEKGFIRASGPLTLPAKPLTQTSAHPIPKPLITIIAIQLLASTFTLPPNPTPGTLPSAFHYSRPTITYDSRPQAFAQQQTSTHSPEIQTIPLSAPRTPDLNAPKPDPRLISSLRLHSYYRYTPAFGHQGRCNSTVPAWPDVYTGPSREEKLAQSISRKRKLAQKGTAASESSSLGEQDGDDDDDEAVSEAGEDTNGEQTDGPGYQLVFDNKPPRRFRNVERIFGRPHRYTSTPIRNLARRTRLRASLSQFKPLSPGESGSDEPIRRWTLQPVLRVEAHPVFIQPVKGLVVRRWRAFKRRG